MNFKKKLLFLIIGLLMTFLLPNNAMAAFTFTAHDTQGKLLDFSSPVKVSGTGTVTSAKKGDVYKYDNVITVDGIQVDAIVSVDDVVNVKTFVFDDPNPNPTPKNSSRHTTVGGVDNYITSFGGVVPEGAIFAPQIETTSKGNPGYVTFTISFQDTSGKPVVLKNVYNNTLDAESTEYNEYGGFVSYSFASDYLTNTTQRMIANPGLAGNIRFSNSNCTGNMGLYITDSSRVQTKFDTITSLKITNGQFATNAVPTASGGLTTCNNTSVRYYGAIFVKDDYTETGNPPVEKTAPTVNLLTTSDTTPSITGTIGGTVSAASPSGSAMIAGDSFSVLVNGVTYTAPNSNLIINGVNWTLNIPTALPIGSYEVVATRNSMLVDQTEKELVITLLCTSPQVLNAAGTACVTPTSTDTILCHSGDGLSYAKLIISSTDTTHLTHPFDVEAVNGSCPSDTITCSPPQILNAAGTACVTPVTSGTACAALTNPLTNIPADSDYDGKKITICHFPPDNPTNVQLNTIDLSALNTHIAHHGDTIWQSSKNCPSTTTSCDTPPTVNSPTTTDKVAAIFSGDVGTSTTLTITIANTSVSNVVITPVTQNGTWTYTAPVIPAGTYAVTVTGDGGSATGTLTVTASVIPTVDTKTTTDKVAVALTGNVGTSNSLTIQVKNSAGAIKDSGTATIIGTTWTFLPVVLPVGTYNVVAIGDAAHGNLTDTTSNELTVTASVIPTVNNTTTTDQIPPILTGSVGTSASLTITVNGISGAAIINGSTWTYKPTLAIPATGSPYNVIATGDTAHGSLVDNTSGELTVTASVIPTVNSTTTTDKIPPTLTGSAGTSTSLTITINGISGAATINGTTWTYTPIAALPIGTYDVIATGDAAHGSLVDTSTNELTVTASEIPTINTKTTTEQIAPVLTGTVGSSKSLTITIKSTPQVSGAAIVSGTTWIFTSPSKIAAGDYDVEALGETGLKDATTNELKVTTCTLPKVFNAAGDDCLDPVPTVVPLNTDSNTPVLTGTVGVVELGTTETFSVTVNGKTYNKSSTVTTSPLVISGLNWSLKIPTSDSISAGIYEVEAARNTVSKDITTKELTINLVCVSPLIFNSTKTACISPVSPTVNNTTTTDQIAPILTGDVGTSTSLSIAIQDSSGAVKATGVAIITGSTWTYTPSAPIAKGIYDVVALGDTGLKDSTTGELIVTLTCTSPKVANSAGTSCITPVPTVDSLNTPDTTPTLTGTVGATSLDTANETFKVTVDGATYNNGDGHLSVSNTLWTLLITTALKPDTYDVDAVRNGTHDETSGELVITDNIAICESGTTKSIARSEWDGSKVSATYYLGQCNAPPCDTDANGNVLATPNNCTPPLPKESDIVSKPEAKVKEAVASIGQTCDDAVGGGVLSDSNATNVTIKRARIANATTEGGTVDLTSMKTKVKYGKYVTGNMDISAAIIDRGQATGVTLTNVTLEDVYIDTDVDYIDDNGDIKTDSSVTYIKVVGGTTLGETNRLTKSPTPPASTITSGIIVAGKDAQGNSVRGNVTSGRYDIDIKNENSTSVMGRRTTGKLVNANILDARTTTVQGVTFVDSGFITSGTMDTGASTFGTLNNATITNTNLSKSNHCFSSGSVGSRGQLNWKEVIKN